MKDLLCLLIFISSLSSCSSLHHQVKNSTTQIKQETKEAQALYEMGEIQAAVANLSALVEKGPYRPAHDLAYELLVEWLLETNNYAEAKRYATQFIQQHPKSPSTKKIVELFNSHAIHERLIVPIVPLQEDSEKDPTELEINIDDFEKKKSSSLAPHALGILLPFSGPLAPFGKKELEAIFLALDTPAPTNLENKISEITALGLKIFIADSGGDVAKTQSMTNNLIQKHDVALILGDIAFDTSVAASQICQERRIPLVSLSRHPLTTNLGNYIFTFNPSFKSQINFLVDYAQNTLGHKRFAILYPGHYYGITMAEAFKNAVLKAGGTVRSEAYDAQETTFTNVIKKLAAIKCLGKRCDRASTIPKIDFEALFIPEFAKLAYLVPALVQADVLVTSSPQALKNYILATKIKKPMPVQLLGLSSWNDKATLQKIGDKANGAFFVDAVSFDESPEHIKFAEAWERLGHGEPTTTEVLAYDATRMIFKILAQDKPSREHIQKSISSFDQQIGLLKNIKFSPEGELLTPSIGFTLTSGASSVVKREGT